MLIIQAKIMKFVDLFGECKLETNAKQVRFFLACAKNRCLSILRPQPSLILNSRLDDQSRN